MTLTQLKNIIKDASIKTKGNIKTLDNNYGYYFKIDSNDHTKFEGAFKKSGIGGLYEYEAESFGAESFSADWSDYLDTMLEGKMDKHSADAILRYIRLKASVKEKAKILDYFIKDGIIHDEEQYDAARLMGAADALGIPFKDSLDAESFGAESKCACGCSIGKCGCDEGCKCGCNHKKGGAKWAQAESFGAEEIDLDRFEGHTPSPWNVSKAQQNTIMVESEVLGCSDCGSKDISTYENTGGKSIQFPKSVEPDPFTIEKGKDNWGRYQMYCPSCDLLDYAKPIDATLNSADLELIASAPDLLNELKRIKGMDAESFEAEVCPCGCAMKGCVCSSSCKGECLNAESFSAESFNDLDYESEQWS